MSLNNMTLKPLRSILKYNTSQSPAMKPPKSKMSNISGQNKRPFQGLTPENHIEFKLHPTYPKTTWVLTRGGPVKHLEIFHRRWARVLIPAVIGLIAYGHWAAFANRHTDHQLMSAVVEGLRTFLFTCIGNLLTETIWSFTKGISTKNLRIPVTCIFTWMTMQSIALSIHMSINRETALMTVAPSLILSCIYVSGYVTGLSRLTIQPLQATGNQAS